MDAGDSVYGYGAEVLMGDVKKPSNTLQPIFEAMSKIGYDAITLETMSLIMVMILLKTSWHSPV